MATTIRDGRSRATISPSSSQLPSQRLASEDRTSGFCVSTTPSTE
jgi:hypothetical protein